MNAVVKVTTPDLEVGRVAECDVELLSPDRNQPRRNFDKDALEELAESIKARGVLQPIQARVFGGLTMIVDGERRWRAAKLAKLKTVPVMLVAQAENLEQLRVDQVAVNQLREQLTSLELGFVLRRMRDDEKKTTNEIAAFLAKNGMGAMAKSEVDGLIDLTYLPAWTHELVDKEEIELKHLAPLVPHAKSKDVMEVAREALVEAIDWGGKATAQEVEEAIDEGLGAQHQRLDGAALFDWKKVCQGCQNLIRNGRSGFCSDEKKFEAKQAEARKQAEEKGRKAKVGGAGGEKPREPTKEELAERTKQRTRSLRQKAEEYLWAYLLRKCLPEIGRATEQLIRFAALKRPGASQWNNNYQLERACCPGCHYPAGAEMPQEKLGSRKAAQDHKIHALDVLLDVIPSKKRAALDRSIALEILFELPFRETLVLAHFLLGDDISKIWKLEPAFLDLFRKSELLHLARKYKVPIEQLGIRNPEAAKASVLKGVLVEQTKRLQAPQILVDLYAKIEKPDRHAFDD